MGSRKHLMAEKRKEERKTLYIAKLNNCPTSPRKMRLVTDLIRGKDAEAALNILKFTQKEAAGRLYKLLLSAIANWQEKNEGVRMEDANLYVKSIMVDSARQLKRIRPAPQGRAHRIRKRSNHVTLILGSENAQSMQDTQEVEEAQTEK
jgi:large subunit ribosomal protein L22